MAKQRHGVIINLEERRQRLSEDNLREASRRMIEAEHALFVALRLAGHRGEQPRLASPRATGLEGRRPAPVLPFHPRRKRAA